MQRDDNEFMDLPENIKLDEDEYILCEFKLVNFFASYCYFYMQTAKTLALGSFGLLC